MNFFKDPFGEKKEIQRSQELFQRIAQIRAKELKERFDLKEFNLHDYLQLYAQQENNAREHLHSKRFSEKQIRKTLENVGSPSEIIFDQQVHENIILQLELEKDGRDHLTNLLTKEAFEKNFLEKTTHFDLAQNDSRRNEDSPQSFGVILIDIDFFKKVNDEHGHLVGDEILKHVAKNLKSSLRKDDFLARWGGEEFALLIEGDNPELFLKIAEKLRFAIEQNPYIIEETNTRIPATISVGVSQVYTQGKTLEDMTHAADSALYAAKGKELASSGYTLDKASSPTTHRNQVWFVDPSQEKVLHHYQPEE